jgi:hypothetical protein
MTSKLAKTGDVKIEAKVFQQTWIEKQNNLKGQAKMKIKQHWY